MPKKIVKMSALGLPPSVVCQLKKQYHQGIPQLDHLKIMTSKMYDPGRGIRPNKKKKSIRREATGIQQAVGPMPGSFVF
jgi:hypothetical protein